jgi:hypothetical protein
VSTDGGEQQDSQRPREASQVPVSTALMQQESTLQLTRDLLAAAAEGLAHGRLEAGLSFLLVAQKGLFGVATNLESIDDNEMGLEMLRDDRGNCTKDSFCALPSSHPIPSTGLVQSSSTPAASVQQGNFPPATKAAKATAESSQARRAYSTPVHARIQNQLQNCQVPLISAADAPKHALNVVDFTAQHVDPKKPRVRQYTKWTPEEDRVLIEGMREYQWQEGNNGYCPMICKYLAERTERRVTPKQCWSRIKYLQRKGLAQKSYKHALPSTANPPLSPKKRKSVATSTTG